MISEAEEEGSDIHGEVENLELWKIRARGQESPERRSRWMRLTWVKRR